MNKKYILKKNLSAILILALIFFLISIILLKEKINEKNFIKILKPIKKKKENNIKKKTKEIKKNKFPFYVFSSKKACSFFYLSGFMGDVQNLQILKKKDPLTGKNNLKIIYKRKNKSLDLRDKIFILLL